MKKLDIVTFGPEDFGYRPKMKAPSLRIHSTRITLGSAAVILMGLVKGDHVRLSQDKKHPEIWYLSKQKTGFPLNQPKKTEPDTLNFYCRGLIVSILDCFGVTEGGLCFLVDESPVDEDNTKYWKLTHLLPGQEEQPDEEEHPDENTLSNQPDDIGKKKRGRKPKIKDSAEPEYFQHTKDAF
jgi:hypothetical protein